MHIRDISKRPEVEDDDFSPAVLNEAFMLKVFRSYADGRAVAAQHVSEVLMSEREGRGLRAVAAQQQPAGRRWKTV